MKRPAAQPRAHLHLGKDEPRRDEGVRDIGREVHLQPVQAQRESDRPADRQMKTVKREAADEDAQGDGRGFSNSAFSLGAEAMKCSTKPGRWLAHSRLDGC